MRQKIKMLLWVLTMTLLLGGCGAGQTSETFTERETVTETAKVQEKIAPETETQPETIVQAETETQTQTDVGSEIQTDADSASELTAYFLDVGQADCTLLESNGHFMLVDAGNNADSDYILSYLNTLGVTKLDYVIGTHPHEDHIGSLDSVIENYEIGTLIMPEKAHDTKTFEDVVTAIENKGLSITPPKLNASYTLGSATFTIITPTEDYGDELNNWSVGIKIINDNTSIVMCGDAEEDTEQNIVNTGSDLKADILKVGHHGSSTSSSIAFLDAVSPKYAVIMCGKDNDYGHPHQETLEELNARNIEIYRTDEQGDIIAKSDGSSWTWNTTPSTSMASGSSTKESSVSTKAKNTQTQAETEKITEAAETEPIQQGESGTIVHVTETGEKYHSAGCQYLKKSDIEISLESAKSSGYTPCSKCNPPQ